MGPVLFLTQVSSSPHSLSQGLLGNLLPGYVLVGTPTPQHLGLAFTDPQLEAHEHIEKQDENTGKPKIPDGEMIWGDTPQGGLSSLPPLVSGGQYSEAFPGLGQWPADPGTLSATGPCGQYLGSCTFQSRPQTWALWLAPCMQPICRDMEELSHLLVPSMVPQMCHRVPGAIMPTWLPHLLAHPFAG